MRTTRQIPGLSSHWERWAQQTLQLLRLDVDEKGMGHRSRARSGGLPLLVAIATVAAGLAVVVQGFVSGLHRVSGGRLIVFVCGAFAISVGIHMIGHVVQHRRRLQAAAVLPWLRERWRERRLASDDYGEALDLMDGPDSEGIELPRLVPAEVRAATRALLVSLEDELRREPSARRRSAHVACRRARLRAAGRVRSPRQGQRVRRLSMPS